MISSRRLPVAAFGLLLSSSAFAMHTVALQPKNAAARRAVAALEEIVGTESNWIQIHAGEVLLETGRRKEMADRFFPLRDEPLPHRVGIWRILAAAGGDTSADFLRRIEDVVLDSSSADRKQAIESLAKLRHAPARRETRQLLAELADGNIPSNTILPLWCLHWAGNADAIPRIRANLNSPDALARQRAGYALRWIGARDAESRLALARTVATEASGTVSRAFLLSAALTLEADPEQVEAWQAELEHILFSAPVAARFEAAMALRGKLHSGDISLLTTLLDNPERDTRVAAAMLILEIDARTNRAAAHP